MPTDIQHRNTAESAEPSVTELVAGIVNDAQTLIKQQFTLLAAEVRNEVRQAKQAAISISIGAGLAALGGVFLLLMVVSILNEFVGLPRWASYGIVGSVLAAIGAGLLLYGRRKVAEVHLAPPPQTAEALKENVQWLKTQTTSEPT
jgi:hypothetical protein